ncbi:DMT family transporter [Gilliamella sp. Lep-s21]|uniref:EamA family transporter n=1 Tax=unclassified Gilliamella TaxID=2685620 RepID=UPI00130CD779|nr:EamA family transporter [Gilliamella sp. Lep-s35]MWP69987.1 EamA family transporter [Gilliamella sp. Lep-s5]MWP77228.1 EamA family transporter [Gilliamella sp. Lep-s21]
MKGNYSVVAILIGVFGFSLKSIFIKLAYFDGITSISLMFFRMIFSIPFFFVAFLLFKDNLIKTSIQIKLKIFLCGFLYYISSYSDITGLVYTSVNIERIILFTIPIFVLFISVIFMKNKFSKKVYILSFFSWIGVSIAFVSNQVLIDKNVHYIGPLLIVLSAITYATYLIISGEVMKKIGFIIFNSQVMIVACLLSLIPMIFEVSGTINNLPSINNFKYPFLLAIVSTVIPSFFMMYGVKHSGAATTAIINNIGPFITMICGYFFLKESIGLFDVIGMCIVIFCVISINKIK